MELEPLPAEGGLFRRTFTGEGASAIYFMLIGDEFSALHRLGDRDELEQVSPAAAERIRQLTRAVR